MIERDDTVQGRVAVVAFHGLNDQDVDAGDDPVHDLVIAAAEGRPGHPQIAAMLSSWDPT